MAIDRGVSRETGQEAASGRTITVMRHYLVLVLAICTVTGSARADSAPLGWQPASAREPSQVRALRRSIERWATPGEQRQLGSQRVAGCRSTPMDAFRGRARCPSVDSIRAVAIDRAIRFFAAEAEEAEGRGAVARSLRALPPMSQSGARAEASRLLGDEAWRADAKALVQAGQSWSVERVAAALGEVIAAAVTAGATRARLFEAAVDMLEELARPLRSLSVRVEAGDDVSSSDRGLAQRIAIRVRRCLRREWDAGWRPVALPMHVSESGEVVVAGGGDARECALERARRLTGSERGHPLTFRVVFGPRGRVWGEPVGLGGDP